MTKLLTLSVLLVLISYTPKNPQRKTASIGPDIRDLLKVSEEILATVESPQFDSKKCKQYLGSLEQSLDKLDVSSLRKENLSNAERIADNAWKIRSVLHTRLIDFEEECVYQIQATFRQMRFIEDYLLEYANRIQSLSPTNINFMAQPVPMLDTKPAHYVTRISDGDEVTFEDGDLLVTRGTSFLSGMIARLGSRATQFSHIVFVHEDPATKKMKTIESYVGVGVQFYDMDYALKNYNARILWLRSKDRGLAHRASKAISKLVKEKNQQKDPIKYDYSLDFSDPSTMSCAEVSQVAFDLASNGLFKIPFYPNEIKGADSLIERLKIAKGPTYEPGDMEIDPRFKLMGEFQDLRFTRDSRHKDAIMSAVFSWMDTHGYKFHDNMTSKMAGGIIHKTRKTFLWPVLRGVLKIDDFSAEIPSNMLSTVTLINKLGEVLLGDLKKKDIAFELKHGVPMSALQLNQVLEKLRLEDLALYEKKKSRKDSRIHVIFRPN